MADEQDEFTSCDVCGRTILRGERIYDYVTPRREEVRVCALCRDQAERSGWLPAEFAGSFEHGDVGRRPRGQLFRERIERAAARARANLPSITIETTERAPEPEVAPAPTPAPRLARTPERVMHRAIEAFNVSHMPRRIAGLIRSLGLPRVAVQPDPTDWRARVTVAWELSWYQWDVTVNGEGEAVREVAKGDEISELPETARAWNAHAQEDGQLRLGT